MSGGRQIIPYSFSVVIPGLTTEYFDLTGYASVIFLHSIGVTSQAPLNTQRVYIIVYPAGEVLGDFYIIYLGVKEFSLGDIQVDLTPSTGNYISVFFENDSAFPDNFVGSLWISGP